MASDPNRSLADASRPAFLPEDSDLVPRPVRARSTLRMAWQLPAFGAGLTILVLTVASVVPRPAPTERSAADLRRELDARLAARDYPAAEEAARAFLRVHEALDAERALVHLALARSLRERTPEAGTRPSDLVHEALMQVDFACALPLPDAERQQACLWAGECLERLGRPADAAERYLKGLSVAGENSGELRLALVRLWSRAERPDFERVIEQVDRVMDDRHLSAGQKAAALESLAEMAFRLGRADEARRRFAAVLERFPETVSAGRAHLFLARLAHAERDWGTALGEARRYLDATPPNDPERVTAAYLAAEGLLGGGQAAEALDAFRHLAEDFFDRPEGEAAALREVQCLVRLGRGTEAAARLKAVAAKTGGARARTPTTGQGAPPPASENPWVTPADRANLVAELRQFLLARAFYQEAIDLAEAAKALVPADQCLETLATAWRLKAEEAARRAEAPGPERLAEREAARQAYIRAGDALVDLAAARRAQPVFIEHLWSAAECYRTAQAYDRAARTLETFRENAFTPNAPQGHRYAETLFYLGECYAAMGRGEEAVPLFKRLAAEAPSHAFAYRARLAWGQVSLARGAFEEAELVLTGIVDNTAGDVFTPRSMIWRKAIFLLGETLHRRGKDEEAIRRLSEAVARYPDERETQHGRHLLAECHRALGLALGEQLRGERGPAAREALERDRRSHFAEAVAFYGQLLERCAAREAAAESLDPLDEAERRNAQFAVADCYLELGQYARAISAYEEAAFRYRDDPRSVAALVQMAEALRAQSRPDLARVAIEKARLLLAALPPEGRERHLTGLTREQWMAWLDWAGRLE